MAVGAFLLVVGTLVVLGLSIIYTAFFAIEAEHGDFSLTTPIFFWGFVAAIGAAILTYEASPPEPTSD